MRVSAYIKGIADKSTVYNLHTALETAVIIRVTHVIVTLNG